VGLVVSSSVSVTGLVWSAVSSVRDVDGPLWMLVFFGSGDKLVSRVCLVVWSAVSSERDVDGPPWVLVFFGSGDELVSHIQKLC